MAFFIPTSIQKRLLRYALSRLELLETDNLDLDSLDIGWGRRSTVELRDLQLRKEKLSALLQLPDQIRLEVARVALVRLTVPSDLYISPIVADIEGVEVRTTLQEPEPAKNTGRRTPRRRNASPGPDATGLPSTRDLAASFLEQEPLEAKQELQAQVQAQSIDLHRSVASSASMAEDDLAAGTGVGLTLPTFFADFLKGISDRLQVNIKDVAFYTQLNLPLPGSGSLQMAQGVITLASRIARIDVKQATDTGATPVPADLSEKAGASKTFHHAGRTITLYDIQGSFLTDKDFLNKIGPFADSSPTPKPFSSPTQSWSKPGSPVTLTGSPVHTFRSISSLDPTLEDPEMSGGHPSQSVSSVMSQFEDAHGETVPVGGDSLFGDDSQHGFRSTYSTSSIGPTEHFSPAEPADNHHGWAQSQVLTDSVSEYHDNVEDDSFPFAGTIEDSLRMLRSERGPSRSSIYYSRSSMPVSLRSESKSSDDESSQLLSRPPQDLYLSDSAQPGLQSPGQPEHAFATDEDVTTPLADHLAESRIYSHEEAESLYLSMAASSAAASEVPATEEVTRSTDLAVPVTIEEESEAKEYQTKHEIAPALTDEPHKPTSGSDQPDPQQQSQYNVPGGWDESADESRLIHNAQPLPELDRASDPIAPRTSPETEPNVESKASSGHHMPTKESDRPKQESENTVETTLFSIDSTEVYIPGPTSPQTKLFDGKESTHKFLKGQSTMLQSSVISSTPGSFSTSFSSYASSTSRRPTMEPKKIESREPKQQSTSRPEPVEPRVSIGKVECRANITTGRILVQLARRLQALFPSDDNAEMEVNRRKTAGAPKESSPWKLAVLLQSLLVEIADPGVPALSRMPSDTSAKTNENKSVLIFQLDKSSLTLAQSSGSQQVNLVLGTLLFDVAGERVISFSKDPQMTESTRDAKATKDDVSLAFIKSSEKSRLDVLTMPLRVDLDFHRIDDTLSSFGGFSGLIELGNSILSESDAVTTPPMLSERPRAVRFDTGAKQAPSQEVAPTSLEVYCRVRGADLMLRGKATTIRYQSTPIKVVSRDALIGLQIDAMKLTAPFVPGGPRPTLEVNANNFRFTYLLHPEERDLSRLISLLTPSKDKFEEEDDFLLDTLLRQRKKGAAARVNIGNLSVSLLSLDVLQKLQEFGIELTKLSVAKYLPEESRPGLLTLGNLSEVTIDVGGIPRLGSIQGKVRDVEFAQVGAPALLAVGIHGLQLLRASGEPLVKEVIPSKSPNQPPMIMARLIGDELEPTLKVKLWNTAIEYSATLAETLMGYTPGQAHPNVAADLTASIATLTDRPRLQKEDSFPSDDSRGSDATGKSMKFDLMLRDCGIGLAPRGLTSKAMLVFTQARLVSSLPNDNENLDAHVDIQKASLHLIDNVDKLLGPESLHKKVSAGASLSRDQLSDLSQLGYVNVFWLQAMTVSVHLEKSTSDAPDLLDLDTKDGLMVMETCADSQKSLTDLLGALSPAMPPAKGQKFRTEIATMDDMMASFTGDAFALRDREQMSRKIDDSHVSFDDAHDVGEYMDEDMAADFDNVGDLPMTTDDEFDDSLSQADSVLSDRRAPLVQSQSEPSLAASSSNLSMRSEIITGGLNPAKMPAKIHGFAKKWDSTNNRYVHLTQSELSQSPVRVRVRDAHVIWNLHDGYDWEKTRDTISKAVYDIQNKAEERRSSRRAGMELDEDEPVIEDFLFNSIYIGIPVSHDPRELSHHINRNMDELMTETGSHTSTTVTARASTAPKPLRPHGKKLRLNRSKRHKIAFELQGVSADVFVFQPGGETQNSIDVRIRDVEVFDHVPTSTWKKFATYMTDAGPREDKKPMLHLEICDVRPIPELIASELVLRVTLLPLRLHVDQDALDFITRFFEFKDESATGPEAPPDQPYLQRVEVRPIPVKLDYKPKKVDYAGLRSGRTGELANFFVLDGAAFVLKHVILYGCAGFLKLHHSLEDVWMPDVKMNQLPTVLSGLNGVRTIVNVGQGVRDLVVIPIQEYQKDGRIVRSIAKGVSAFGRSTGGELTRFGAKLAVGAQHYLQGAEDLLSRRARAGEAGWEDGDLDEDERRAISHYADQPAGILQGLRGAAKSLERDLLVAKDVIIAIAGEIREADNAEGAARAIARNAPTLILRPMIGASKAISQTLMGATNSVDPENRKRVEDKYKRY